MTPTLVAIVLAATSIAAAQTARVEQGRVPNKGTGIIHADLLFIPDSLEALCDSSTLIVDATVLTRLPSRRTSPNVSLETDFVISISQTFKGDANLRQTLVAEMGGSIGELLHVMANDSLMQAGERYVLFLTPDARPELPPHGDLPRYMVTGLWIGKARIRGNAVMWNVNSPPGIRDAYDGITAAKLFEEIRSVAQR